MKNISHKFVAIVTTGVMMSKSYGALAAGQSTNFTNVTSNIKASAAGLPDLIATAAYIAGIGLGVAGILKLKEHVDNPTTAPLKAGLIRLGAGGGLLTLPYITNAMIGSVGEKSTNKVVLGDVSFGVEGF